MGHLALPRIQRRLLVATVLATLLLTTAALALLNDGVVLRTSVLDSGGEELAGGNLITTTTLGDAIAHPREITGGSLVMRPGFIAKKKRATGIPTSVPENSDAIATGLQGNFPNPFRDATSIRFSLAGSANASLRIYDVRGRLVRSLVEGPVAAGRHVISWDGRSRNGARVAAGVYFMRLVSGDFVKQQKIVMAR